jgi:crotonobetainyl-CoA:carnitine CoA-transferase CaiB-like acyl-CoA transferase
MGRPELAADPMFASHEARKTNEMKLDSLIAQWTSGCDAMELSSRLQAQGIAAARSQSSLDLVADSQLWQRGFYHQVTDPAGGHKTTLGPSWNMSRAAEVTDAAPRLGEHNAYVFGEILGLSTEQQKSLSDRGITV